MQRRGRSRQISPAAIARQASEERRTSKNRASQWSAKPAPLLRITPQRPPAPKSTVPQHTPPNVPPPMTIVPVLSPPSTSRSRSPSPIRTPTDAEPGPSPIRDLYDSPPSPPRSIEDQLHVAYALDDIKLAKIILLKLKGINVIDDNDPVIDTVRDEDFDAYFVPAGGLVVDIDGKKPLTVDLEERRRREKEMFEERQRRERLKECERRWDEEKRRANEERLKIARKKEEEEEEKRKAEDILKQIELEAERMRSLRQRRPGLHRSLVAYDINTFLDTSSTSKLVNQEPFKYDCMPSMKSSIPQRRSPKSKVDSPPRISCSVPFKDVLSSMSGPLFPLEPSEQTRSQERNTYQDLFSDAINQRHSWPASQPSRPPISRPVRSPLQYELLANLLKVVEWEDGERRRRKGKSTDFSPRKRQRTNSGPCAACSAASSSTSSSSRSGSWLSFGGSGRSSTSIYATTPASSPVSLWLKSKPSTRSSPSSPLSKKVKAAPLGHSCEPSNRLTSVIASESPLPLPVRHCKSTRSQNSEASSRILNGTAAEMEVKSNNLLRRMSTLVDLAKGFPAAYITTTILNVATASDTFTRKGHSSPSTTACGRKFRPKPRGCRARPSDVSIFISASQELSIPATHAPQYIPLTNPHPPTSSEITPRSLVFPPTPPLPRSPFRPIIPPSALLWRTRPVGNPVALRLQALQNVLYQQGLNWEGRGRDGMLSCGREKLVGVAWEGLGRSGLSWQMTATC